MVLLFCGLSSIAGPSPQFCNIAWPLARVLFRLFQLTRENIVKRSFCSYQVKKNELMFIIELLHG